MLLSSNRVAAEGVNSTATWLRKLSTLAFEPVEQRFGGNVNLLSPLQLDVDCVLGRRLPADEQGHRPPFALQRDANLRMIETEFGEVHAAQFFFSKRAVTLRKLQIGENRIDRAGIGPHRQRLLDVPIVARLFDDDGLVRVGQLQPRDVVGLEVENAFAFLRGLVGRGSFVMVPDDHQAHCDQENHQNPCRARFHDERVWALLSALRPDE